MAEEEDETTRELNEILALAEQAERDKEAEVEAAAQEYLDSFTKHAHGRREEQETEETQEGRSQEPQTYVDENGVRYQFNYERNGWFPVIDEDVVHQSQQGYIYVPEQKSALVKFDEKGEEVNPEPGHKKRHKSEVGWQAFDPSKNSNVYVTLLPEDVTVDEIHEFFKRVGVIKKDIETGEPRIKLYKDKETGKLKGDGLVTFLLPASVDLAVSILDETELRPGVVIRVSKAVFQPKTDFDPAQMKKKKKKKPKFDQFKQVSWELTHEHAEFKKKNVVLKNLFHPSDFKGDPLAAAELKQDIQYECGRIGPIERFDLYEENPEGVVFIRYKMGEHAEKCIEVMNGRYFAGKKVEADFWDGKTKFHKEAPKKTDEERLEEFAKFLEED